MATISGTTQIIQYTLRTAQASLALTGLGFLLSYDFDTNYINSTFASQSYINFLLFVFGFSIAYPIYHILLMLDKVKPDLLGNKQNKIITGIEFTWLLLWGFTAISLLMKLMKAGCVLLDGYIGLCSLAFPLDILGFVMLTMSGATFIFALKLWNAPPGSFEQ